MKMNFVLLMLAVASSVINSGSTQAQENMAISEAYQLGLVYISKEHDIKLPERWMMTDREMIDQKTVELFAAKSDGDARISMYTLQESHPDQAQEFVLKGLQQLGKVTNKSEKNRGDLGSRRSTSWFLLGKDKKSFELFYFKDRIGKVDVLQVDWPLDKDDTVEGFEEKRIAEVEALIKSTVNSFYGASTTDVGTGLIYNGIIANNAARVSLKLPVNYQYTSSASVPQLWEDTKSQGKTISLNFGERKEGFERFKANYPDELQRKYARPLVNKKGSIDNEYLTGAIETKYTTHNEGKWDYVYILSVPALDAEGNVVLDKKNPVFLSFLNIAQYREAPNSTVISLTYQEKITLGSNPIATQQIVEKTMANVKPVFDSFSVLPISK